MPNRWWPLISASLTILAPLTAVATDVPPGSVSGTWNLPGSPYHVLGDITVPSGQSLTIDPGVEVVFQGAYRLTALGTIEAVGTVTDSIHITGTTSWDQIRLENETETSRFEYCRIAGAETGLNSIDSPVDIVHCHLHDHETAINIFGIGNATPAAVTVSGSLIEACQNHGIFIAENSNAVVNDCEITQCALSGSPRGAIQLSNQSPSGSNDPVITENWIHHNVWQGLTAFDVTGAGNIAPLIEGNVIEYNLTGVYLLYASGSLRDNQINHNFVAGNPNSGAGVMVAGAASQPVLTNNTLTGNFTALYVIDGAQPNLGDLGNASSDDDGRNHMYDNVDGGGNTWSIYSNSTADIMAENNLWDSEDYGEIAETVFDGNDNPAYGIVDFDPLMQTVGIEDAIAVAPATGLPVIRVQPNPLRSRTTIQFRSGEIMTGQWAGLSLHDAGGRLVRKLFEGRLDGGIHVVEWEGTDDRGRDLPSGTYFCHFRVGGFDARQRIVLLR